MKDTLNTLVLALTVVATLAVEAKPTIDQSLNIAKAELHPYVDHTKGREGFRFTDRPVNEARVYDFYQRQADYYMSGKVEIPAIIPSYPGLDGGKHGHWGKNNQNDYRENRWNEMDKDGFLGQQIDGVAPDGHSLVVDPEQKMYAAFSAKANLSYFRYWEGDFIKLGTFRWGTSSGAEPSGEMVAQLEKSRVDKARKNGSVDPSAAGWRVSRENQHYVGMFDTDHGPVYSYEIKGVSILDTVTSQPGKVFQRVIESQGSLGANKIALFDLDKKGLKREGRELWSVGAKGGKSLIYISVVTKGGVADLMGEEEIAVLDIKSLGKGQQVCVLFGESMDAVVKARVKVLAKSISLVEMSTQRTKKWDETYTVTGTLAMNDRPYVVDDIPVPFKNDKKSLMFLTDTVFDEEGDAYITTLMGELWKVTGLHGDLKSITWKRIARGLNQPFGIKIWDGKIHVLERDQITYLEDRNNDGEMDFYGNFSNLVPGLNASHSHTFGMAKDKEGYIHFVAAWSSYRISPDGKEIEEMTRGLRNCMGFGHMSDGTILVGPQEGTNTPTSEIIEVRKGDNHGFKNNDTLSLPLGYVPRGVDNSTGGFLEVESDRWGPLGKKSLIGICYGSSSWYQVLFDKSAKTTGHRQVATVPMQGDFISGVTRGSVNPADGQVYVVGLDGWGDYSVNDGCLHRIRYTGKALLEAVGYEVYDNGIKVDFLEELDPDFAANQKHYFAQMWNYNNSGQYGSPEFSVKNPESLGHDPLPVTSVRLLEDKKSIFVEIPSLQPAMQVHLRMHLKSKIGVKFESDLFPTIVKLGNFYPFEGAIPKQDKPREFVLRTDRKPGAIQKLLTTNGLIDEHAKKVQIKTIPGLKYDRTKFTVKAGESVALELKNIDSMPHNIVITKPGKKQQVGETAFKMMNDPNARKKNYVPDDKSDLIAYSDVVEPTGKHTTYFKAPKEKGEYPFICTFPGHWQVMQGVMIVE